MSKPKVNSKIKNKNQSSPQRFKGLLVVLVGLVLILITVLWSSLFKNYPVEGQKQMIAIGDGDTYSGFIDRLAKEDKVSFPIILKIYQKFMIHDTMKAGVYEVTEGMSVRQVLDLFADADNAQMNRLLVIKERTLSNLLKA